MSSLPEKKNTDLDEINALMRINTELMSELWILRDRVIILEKVLEEKGILEAKIIDNYVPDENLSQEIETERDKFVRRIAGAPWAKEINLESLIKNGHR